MFPLFPDTGTPSHNLFVVKNIRKCRSNPLDFKFYLGQFNNKFFSIWYNVNFESVFTALNNTKKQRKFNITPNGGNFH